MTAPRLSFKLTSPDATALIARDLGARLKHGDTVLLSGSVGAGKTHFARALITSLLTAPEDIPSPTFTLVQTYETAKGLLWHADLYRIGSVHDIEELGLTEAFTDAICLVEWPDRLGDLRPSDALDLTLSQGDEEETRHLDVQWEDPRWHDRLKGWAA